MMYYVARDGQQYGPYSDETIRQYLVAGSLLLTDHAREETAQSWSTLGHYFPPASHTPATPQPYTSGPAYGQQPAYAQPTYGQQQAANWTGQPVIPPDLHWALVCLLFGTGVFVFVWALIQASYARKIDAASKATVYFILWTIGSVINLMLYIGLVVMIVNNNLQTSDSANSLGAVIFLIAIGCSAFYLAGAYSIRASMLKHYNTSEPIQLKLSGVMTFFFTMLYLQYHMSRIAAWKKTGYLSAQG